jgi:hypothetical protein
LQAPTLAGGSAIGLSATGACDSGPVIAHHTRDCLADLILFLFELWRNGGSANEFNRPSEAKYDEATVLTIAK